ncbi:MAG TPA: hypothetical protein VFN74_00105 [Chloroflexota bacterium]|nr:hypothetical protein [Chloroflexota bacterium]
MASALLTTQPGWAFATLAELRGRGVGERVELHHRDSTLVLPAGALPREGLVTPAETCGVVAEGYARGGWDATRALVDALWRTDVARAVGYWGRGDRGGRRPRTWTVVSEVWGETQVQRRQLGEAVRQAMRAAFPRWREAAYEEAGQAEVRLVVKGDTRAALAGVQLGTNLEAGGGGRPGALRGHLACGLLAVAGLAPATKRMEGRTVVDPFAGSGTILEMAARHFGASAVMGAEVERGAVRLARQRLRPLAERGVAAEVLGGSFEEVAERVPEGAYLVSNLPFGERFGQIETEELLAFLDEVAPRAAGVALLMAREQGSIVAERVGLRAKNVIILGQAAAIAYGVRQRIESREDNDVRPRRRQAARRAT